MSEKDLKLGEDIKFDVKKRFGIITIARGERSNALTLEMLQDIKNALEYCQENEKIRGIILTGEGNSFTSGLDIKEIDVKKSLLIKKVENIASNITALLYYGKPVICAINGLAMGDGVIFALASDYRIAVENAYFQMPEINYGIFPGTGCIVLMTRIIGISWTKRMLMFAEKIDPEKAVKIGLIDEIADNKEDLMKIALNKAKFLFTKNQTVLNAIKICSNHLQDKSYSEAYDLEKMGSSWYEYDDKEEFLSEFRKRFM
ncbi:MAG: enoyl-CoA hydratase/isomerase family protein [Promethearchaeota archaeon]